MAERRFSLTSPWTVGALLALLLLLSVLVAPTDGRRGDARLSARNRGPMGASGLEQVARRLGWRTELATNIWPARLDSGVVHLVLDPTVPLTAGETHRLLNAVRAGAGLLLVPRRGTPLADSLGVSASTGAGVLSSRETPACTEEQNQRGALDWPRGEVLSLWVQARPPLPVDTVSFAGVIPPPRLLGESVGTRRVSNDRPLPASVGFPLGRGRVVVVADPDLLRNDVLRVCEWGMSVAAVRTLEWLSEGRERRLVFDELHHEPTLQADPIAAVRRWLTNTPPGRMLLQGAAAAVVLLLAAGARAIAPRPRARAERRSPLEHVSALARAYEDAGATRLASRRLVHGLRRR
ncbi:MAG TPA: DUF4350 domain-containing protein, partial [Gemmatimonadaceae bacterium]|nr:DUF4350 domain-containing protein [Gemmatimonadaceae bacterium]